MRSDAGHARSGEERRDIGVSESEGMTENVRTSHRKTREGRVLRTLHADDPPQHVTFKTVVVAVEDRVKHSLYGKVIRRTNKLKAHDATNTVTIGDRVLIMETRPLSATKRWRVVEVLEKAKYSRSRRAVCRAARSRDME